MHVPALYLFGSKRVCSQNTDGASVKEVPIRLKFAAKVLVSAQSCNPRGPPKTLVLAVCPSFESGKRLQRPSPALSPSLANNTSILIDCFQNNPHSEKKNNNTTAYPVPTLSIHRQPVILCTSKDSGTLKNQINQYNNGDRSKSRPHQIPQYPGCLARRHHRSRLTPPLSDLGRQPVCCSLFHVHI